MATGSVKAVALITGDSNVRGSLHFIQEPNGATHVTGRITGLSPGLHGFHIHALGDTTNGCNSTGPHFNPLKKDHGAPSDNERHAGDLGNITAGSDGVAEVSIKDLQIPLSGMHSILGRAVVVHADPDDLGKGGHELSKTTGNAGARVGCVSNGASLGSNHLFKVDTWFDGLLHQDALLVKTEAGRRRRTSF
ncbi:hypothetical protein POTOM_045266 [Populus tomentosa]|uniref:superoxide dismutase n=1 Tax=Populus tomentosa TaxID=118781 RepID=A0A8X8C6K9_POPTO|nr:hypothetical protein POTOM_045266 [Populus tomentosa]